MFTRERYKKIPTKEGSEDMAMKVWVVEQYGGVEGIYGYDIYEDFDAAFSEFLKEIKSEKVTRENFEEGKYYDGGPCLEIRLYGYKAIKSTDLIGKDV